MKLTLFERCLCFDSWLPGVVQLVIDVKLTIVCSVAVKRVELKLPRQTNLFLSAACVLIDCYLVSTNKY